MGISATIIECIVVFALILVNGFFSMAEMAIVSSRKARLKQLADEGRGSARVALRLAEEPTHFLSTVQIGITLVGILAGAYGGATLASRLAPHLEPWLHEYAYGVSFGVVVAAVTFMSVVIGELVPKRLALMRPEGIAMAVSRALNLITKVFYPVVKLLTASTELVFRFLPIEKHDEPGVTDEEVKSLMEQGAESGHFHEAEAEIVSMALRLGDRRVASLMTTRAFIDYLDVDDVDEVTRNTIVDSAHSRLPLVRGDFEHVLGVVQSKDMLAALIRSDKLDLKNLSRPVPFIPQNAAALKALELFKTSGAAMAIVVDEYGVVTGLITLNDILEALVGDLADPDAEDDGTAVQREDGSWLIDGLLPIEELRHLLGAPQSSFEGEHNTVAGLVLSHLNRVAKVADHLEIEGYRFEVMDMDDRRIDKILVVATPKASETPSTP